MKRCFISINIPEKIKEKILEIQNQLPEFEGKITERENLHLTLKFLGEISDEKVGEVLERLRKIEFQKFEAGLESIGVFSEDFFRIVWLHLTNCGELQKIIDEKMEKIGFEKEKRFMSHLTIARVKGVGNKKEFLEKLRSIKIPEIMFEVDKFYLMESILKEKGPVYRVVEEYELG